MSTCARRYTAIEIAEYVLDKCVRDGCPISNLHLQPILYFLQKAFLKKKQHLLFKDKIYAGKYVPIVLPVHERYCLAGAYPLLECYDTSLPKDVREILDPEIERLRSVPLLDLIRGVKEEPAWKKAIQSNESQELRLRLEEVRYETWHLARGSANDKTGRVHYLSDGSHTGLADGRS